MNKLDFLLTIPLFTGFTPSELKTLLAFSQPPEKSFQRHNYLLKQGDPLLGIAILLAGKVQIIKEDILGNREILSTLAAGDIFAEVFTCAQLATSPVSVVALTKGSYLYLAPQYLTAIGLPLELRLHLNTNLVRLLAQKALLLNSKLLLLSQRSLRKKLMFYFTQQTELAGKNTFTLAYSRNELADFLCVNRSALSRELGKMQAEGLLQFNRNEFSLFPPS
ncbi:MAG: Crp/Fnr family transcriptional regulator [Acidaminococcaceae bacterium]